jgi:hypothetical protein
MSARGDFIDEMRSGFAGLREGGILSHGAALPSPLLAFLKSGEAGRNCRGVESFHVGIIRFFVSRMVLALFFLRQGGGKT